VLRANRGPPCPVERAAPRSAQSIFGAPCPKPTPPTTGVQTQPTGQRQPRSAAEGAQAGGTVTDLTLGGRAGGRGDGFVLVMCWSRASGASTDGGSTGRARTGLAGPDWRSLIQVNSESTARPPCSALRHGRAQSSSLAPVTPSLSGPLRPPPPTFSSRSLCPFPQAASLSPAVGRAVPLNRPAACSRGVCQVKADV
jgi:hypothetical protein